MKSVSKKDIFIMVIGSLTLLVSIGIITYAILAGDLDLSNGNLNANASTGELNYYFEAVGGNDILLEITAENMDEERHGNVAASNNTTMNISFISGEEDFDMYCTYDLVWVWDTTDVVKNRYVKSEGAVREYTVSGSNGAQSFSEKQVNNYGTNTVLYTGYITSSSLTPTIQNWQITASFNNLDLNQNRIAGSSYDSKVKVENVNCKVGEFPNWISYSGLSAMILADNGGALAIEAKESPDFDEISPIDGGETQNATYETTSRGMYAAEDDFGTSYYYRGNVENNWVKLDGATTDMYFRIIRINGDGTVRMIYTGTTAPTEVQKVVMTGVGTQIGTKAFNTLDDSAEYVGYRYTLGEARGLSETSTIKGADFNPDIGTLDRWYIDNILSNSQYVNAISQEQILCNDRSGMLNQDYGPYARIAHLASPPTLNCSDEFDEFTVDGASAGNNTLQYPVGLITADEAAMAGGTYMSSNYEYYLYTGQNYWTASPAGAITSASLFYIDGQGYVEGGFRVSEGMGVRPVISLKSDVEVTGTGQWNDPYVVDGT